jgi:hypothetical protein
MTRLINTYNFTSFVPNLAKKRVTYFEYELLPILVTVRFPRCWPEAYDVDNFGLCIGLTASGEQIGQKSNLRFRDVVLSEYQIGSW